MRDLPTPTFAFGPQPRTGLKPVARLLRPRLPAEPAMGAPTAPQPEPAAQPGIVVAWARHQDEVRAAQRLRYDVFAREMGARLASPLEGHDIDLFDDYCEHLLVRDAASQAVIGTYRVLTPAQARRVGSTYSDTEFDLTRLRGLRSRMVELGRSCVHAEYRNGGVIMVNFYSAFLEPSAAARDVERMARNAVGAVNNTLTPWSAMTRQKTPGSGVPTGLPSNKIVVQPWKRGA